VARPAKIPSDVLSRHMRPYLVRDLVFNKDKEKAIVDHLIKNDAEVALEISKATGIEIDRNQIVYWRRKNNVQACGDDHGGARDYASGYDVVRLLHQMDTYRLSVEWLPGLTGGVLTPAQRECCQKLNQIARKIKNRQKKIAALRDEVQQAGIENQIIENQIARKIKEITALRASARKIAIDYNIALPLPTLPTAVGGEDIEDFSSSYCGGKRTKGGGRVSIQAGQFYGA
jgi:hypothetical protein